MCYSTGVKHCRLLTYFGIMRLLVAFILVLSCKSQACPHRQVSMMEQGRTCPPPCLADEQCVSPRSCQCDDFCGMSCFNTLATCLIDSTLEPVNGFIAMPFMRLTRGVQILFNCYAGYRLAHRDARACRSDGKWSGSTPACIPVLCPAPPQPKNGYLTPFARQQWPFNSFVTYNCYEPFVLNGYYSANSATFRCTKDQTWNGTTPDCVLKSLKQDDTECTDPNTCPNNGYCASPSDIEHGWIEVDREYNSLEWSGPRVSSKDDIIQQNSISVFWPPDEVIVYLCDDGYQLVGGSERRACEDGKWTGIQPSCERAKEVDDCWPPNRCLNANTLRSERPIKDNGWTSNAGYAAPQPRSNWPSCLNDGTCDWGQQERVTGRNFFTYIDNALENLFTKFSRCSSPKVAYGRRQRRKKVWKAGETAIVTCLPGFPPPRHSVVICVSGLYWDPEPLKLCSGCVNPKAANGKVVDVRESYSWPIGGTFSVRCFDGFRPPRPNLSTCLSSLRWSKPMLKCVRSEPWKKYCEYPQIENGWGVSPYVFSFIKRLFVRSRWVPGDDVLYKCHPSHRLVRGNKRRTCRKDGTWSGIKPTCEYHCTLNFLERWFNLRTCD